ncbi:hypothetical protein KC974_02520 [Candidatus Saccharibacteria bacterium]|nr:hypothetical protein [Candidatus Saccharibacteria bacterium]
MPTGRPGGENVFNIGAERLAPSIEYVKEDSLVLQEEKTVTKPEDALRPPADLHAPSPEQLSAWNSSITEQISAMRGEVLRNVA